MDRVIGFTYGVIGCVALAHGDHVAGGFFLLIGNMWFLFGKDCKK